MKQFLPALFLLCCLHSFAQPKNSKQSAIQPGAYQLKEYLPLLKGKRIGIFANHTATVGTTHLVDLLQKMGLKITKAFGPEHGFRGKADAGEKVSDYKDPATGIPVISLYGKKRKPSAEDLADVDVMVFDIQDVGVRFYTFISSLQEFMESAIEHGKPLIILDRPNPNGFYLDGPVLDTAYKSFVGMQPVPVVYGMTIGEYATMLLKENWLNEPAKSIISKTDSMYTAMKKDLKAKGFKVSSSKAAPAKGFSLTIIKCKNYDHNSTYELPVKPSPNLPDYATIYWYPSTCFFEGTVLSEGRGTDHPFCIFGHPSLPKHLYTFTPTSREGAASPKLLNKQCYGWNIYETKANVLKAVNKQLQLKWLIDAYAMFPEKDSFFITSKSGQYFFDKLAGDDQLRKQLITGKSESAIRASWQTKLQQFKATRKKYLLYKDFE